MRRSLVLLLALIMLAACSPALQDAASAGINTTIGDAAQLEPRPTGLLFFPQGRVTDVLIDVQGEELRALDPSDNCEGDAAQLTCAIGTLTQPVTVELRGRDVSAVVFYKRSGVPKFEVLQVPAAVVYPRLTYPQG